MVIGGPSKKPKKKHVNGAAFAGRYSESFRERAARQGLVNGAGR